MQITKENLHFDVDLARVIMKDESCRLLKQTRYETIIVFFMLIYLWRRGRIDKSLLFGRNNYLFEHIENCLDELEFIQMN